MKKITQVLFLLVGLIGVTFISTAQAVQPFNFITYGDVNAAFQTIYGSSIVIEYDAGVYHAAPVEGNIAHISPFFPTYHYVEDAHFTSVAWFFNTETHEEALEFYKMEKDGFVKTHYYIDGVELLQTKITALKRALWVFPPEAKYGWWYATGVLFQPGEILAGSHQLDVTIEVEIAPGVWDTAWELTTPFYFFNFGD